MTIAAALISALLAGSPTAVPAASAAPSPTVTETPNPISIYHRAIAAMKAADAHRPAYVVYQIDYTGHNLVLSPETTNGKTAWNMDLHHANDSHVYQVWYRTHDDRALTQDRATHYVYRGEALLAPVAANVLESASPSPTANTSPSPAASGAPDTAGGATTEVLGSVTVEASRFYDITLIGVESNNGHAVYHLHMHARKDIPDHPLTDLYIDTATYLVRAAHAEVTRQRLRVVLSCQHGLHHDLARLHASRDAARFVFHRARHAVGPCVARGKCRRHECKRRPRRARTSWRHAHRSLRLVVRTA